MSHFSVALTEILARLKGESGVTSVTFAANIGMPISTLRSYASHRSRPDAQAIATIAAGVPEDDARRLILAHIEDETPEGWRERIAQATFRPAGPVRLADCDHLPVRFRRALELIVSEAQHNQQIIEFVIGLEELLRLGTDEGENPRNTNAGTQWPRDEKPKFKVHPVPAGTVRSQTGPRSSLTPSSEESAEVPRAAEEPPAIARPKTGPRVRSTRGIRRVTGKHSS